MMRAEARWDIFCQVIDNYGDLGVSWRLAVQLAGRGQRVRLWVDDASALAWMAPDGCDGVSTHGFAQAGPEFVPGDVVIEAFGCALPPPVIEAIARASRDQDQDQDRDRDRANPEHEDIEERDVRGDREDRRNRSERAEAEERGGVCWINLEYLSAEAYVGRSHGLMSPVYGSAAGGAHKWFFFPGFTADTGGLLREPELLGERARFDRAVWLAQHGIAWHGEPVVTLFCYEPPHLAELLRALAQTPALLLVAAGRATAAVRAENEQNAKNMERAMHATHAGLEREGVSPGRGRSRTVFLPFVSQAEFDRMLWCGDCNFVRGEDSLVRALWAGAPFVWQPYPQEDAVRDAKLSALLDWLGAPDSLRGFHRIWDGREEGALPADLVVAPPESWRACVAAARARALTQDDLVTRLLRFVAKNR